MVKKRKPKYVGTTYDVFVTCKPKGKKEGKTMMTFLGKNISDVKKQAKKVYKPFCKITKVKKITRTYRYI